MKNRQSLNILSSGVLSELDNIWEFEKPDLVIIQGDTTTSLMIAMAAFHRNIDVLHIEAGLRTYNLDSPYPEEFNRQILSKIAKYHCAATIEAKENLIAENINERNILVTGNTVIDSLFYALNKIVNNPGKFELQVVKQNIKQGKKIILVTCHRREDLITRVKKLADSITNLAKREDVVIVWPLHLNPLIRENLPVNIFDRKNIYIVENQDYPSFIWLMSISELIITDSGGIQEEAPSLQKPVIVIRNETERSESLELGYSFLTGLDSSKIYRTAIDILDKNLRINWGPNPYGDGKSCENVRDFIIDKIAINKD